MESFSIYSLGVDLFHAMLMLNIVLVMLLSINSLLFLCFNNIPFHSHITIWLMGRWIFGLFPVWGYYKWALCKNYCTSVLWMYGFIFLGCLQRVQLSGHTKLYEETVWGFFHNGNITLCSYRNQIFFSCFGFLFLL